MGRSEDGIAPEELTRRAKIPLTELVDRDRRVPRSWGTEITRALKELLPELPLGIEAGQFWSLDRIGYLGELVRHSSSVREALEKSLRVLPLIDTSILDEMPYIRTAGDEVGLVMTYGKQEFWEEWVESLAFSSVQQIRALTEETVVPLRACFTYDLLRFREKVKSFPNFNTFYGDSDLHTFTAQAGFYTLTTKDGRKLVDWFSALVKGNNPGHAGP